MKDFNISDNTSLVLQKCVFIVGIMKLHSANIYKTKWLYNKDKA